MNPFEDTLHSLYKEPNDLITQNNIDEYYKTKSFYESKSYITQDINTFLK